MAEPRWKPPTRCATLEANLSSYQLHSNSFKGGTFMSHPPEGTRDPAFRDATTLADSNASANRYKLRANSYLRTLPKERQEEYLERLRRAYFPNFCQEVIRVYVGTLFREGYSIERSSILAALGEEIAGNIDRLGRDVNAYLRDVFAETLQAGWTGTITDRPAAPRGGYESAAEEAEADQRPYSRIVLPPQLWDWRVDPDDGDWTFLLIHEGAVKNPDTDELEDRWKVWTRKVWALIDKDGNELARGKHGRRRIPFDLCTCDPASLDADDEPFGHSALRDVAQLNLEIFQQSSLLEDLARKTNYPTLFGKGNPAEVERAQQGAKKGDGSGPEMGAGYMLIAPIEFAYQAPPDSCMRTGMEYIDRLIRDIRRIAGIATRSEESTEAHSGAALLWEYSTRYDLVKLRADGLRDFEVRLWRTYADYLGKEIAAESVRYPTTYATAPVPQDLEELQAMQDAGMPPEVIKAQKRSIVVKRFSHLPDLQDLLEAVDREPDAPPKAPAAPPPPAPPGAEEEEAEAAAAAAEEPGEEAARAA